MQNIYILLMDNTFSEYNGTIMIVRLEIKTLAYFETHSYSIKNTSAFENLMNYDINLIIW